MNVGELKRQLDDYGDHLTVVAADEVGYLYDIDFVDSGSGGTVVQVAIGQPWEED